jgi:hypothetical protein
LILELKLGVWNREGKETVHIPPQALPVLRKDDRGPRKELLPQVQTRIPEGAVKNRPVQ